MKRELTKVNYRIHTDAIKENLIPQELTSQQTSIIYTSDDDSGRETRIQISKIEKTNKSRRHILSKISFLKEMKTEILSGKILLYMQWLNHDILVKKYAKYDMINYLSCVSRYKSKMYRN